MEQEQGVAIVSHHHIVIVSKFITRCAKGASLDDAPLLQKFNEFFDRLGDG